jgi:hypothetical protein
MNSYEQVNIAEHNPFTSVFAIYDLLPSVEYIVEKSKVLIKFFPSV